MNPDQIRMIKFTGREKAELVTEKRETPELKPDEVAGPTILTLISPGTELGAEYLADTGFPKLPGYTAVFEVAETGEEVEDLEPGQTVMCSGGWIVAQHRSWQRVPRKACIPVPEGMDPAVAAHARLMSVTMSTLTTTAARPPERVVVFGLGIIGNLGAQTFQACGYEVAAVEPMAERREIATSKGIDPVWESAPLDDPERIADVALCLECSGHELGIMDAVRTVRKGGEVAIVGVPRTRKSDLYAFDLLEPVFRGYVTLRSGWEWEVPRHGAEFRHGSVWDQMRGAIRWLREDRVSVDGLYEFASPADCQQVYQDLLNRKTESLSVLFDWSKMG